APVTEGWTSALDIESPNWSPADGSLYNTLRDEINNGISRLQQAGRFSGIASVSVLWSEGEKSAVHIADAEARAAQYEAALMTIFTSLKADCPGLDYIFIAETGINQNGTYTTELAAVRAAQANVVSALSYVHWGWQGAKDILPEDMSSEWHLDQAGYDLMGEAFATALNGVLAA